MELEPGEQETVTIGIAVPDRVDSGGYYARISFTTLNEDLSANAAALAGQLGVGLMLTIEGDGEIVRDGEITRFAPVLEADGRIGFRMEVLNNGNVHLIAPAGNVVVTYADGAALGSLDFPETLPLLPGAQSILASHGSLPLTPGASYIANGAFTFKDGSDEGVTMTASTEFTAEALLSLAATTVCENLDRGPSLNVTLQNESQLGLQPLVTLVLEAVTGELLGSAPVSSGTLLWPGERQEISVDFPERLVSGAYRLITTVQFDPTAAPVTQETPFQIGGLDGKAAPLCSEQAA